MTHNLKRLTIRSVSRDTTDQLRCLHNSTRLPMALLIEDAVDLLWQHYEDDGVVPDDESQ